MNCNHHKNVIITPYTELMDVNKGLSFHKGGPIWDPWEESGSCRLLADNRPIDDKPDIPVEPLKKARETLFWCGAITSHFGHQITDFSTRIMAYRQHHSDGFYCFAGRKRSNLHSYTQTPEFFKGIVSWLGVPPERVKLISRPVLAESLLCSPQQEQRNAIPPSDKYLDLLTDMTNKRLGRMSAKKGTYYITRSGIYKGTIAAEIYLDYLFSSIGVRVIRPETISVAEQLRIYCSADRIIFSEGSAVHGLQLLGRNIRHCDVITRRPKAFLAQALISKRCTRLNYHSLTNNIVCGLLLNGKQAMPLALIVPSKKDVQRLFRSLGFDQPFAWSDQAFHALVRKDIELWLARELTSPRAEVEGSLSMIREKLKRIGYEFDF